MHAIVFTTERELIHRTSAHFIINISYLQTLINCSGVV